MKKTILIVALALIGAGAYAQKADSVTKIPKKVTKADTLKRIAKPVYNYFVTLPAQDYQQLVSDAHQFRDLTTYSPFLTGDQKTNTQANTDYYLVKQLPSVIKIDSVQVKIPPVKKSVKSQ